MPGKQDSGTCGVLLCNPGTPDYAPVADVRSYFRDFIRDTLEETAMENRDNLLEAGGEPYAYIPCSNDGPAQMNLFAERVTGNL